MEQTNSSVWVVGDIHGCFATLETLIAKIKPYRLYTLGDHINRGSDSKRVLDYFIYSKHTRCVAGNHEDMLLKAYDSGDASSQVYKQWLARGGDATLKSFGIPTLFDMPKVYISWMRELPVIRKYDRYIISHAGADMNKGNPFNRSPRMRNLLLYRRNVPEPVAGRSSIVHGHTVMDHDSIIASLATRKISLDGGCVYGGRLYAFNLHTKQLEFSDYCG